MSEVLLYLTLFWSATPPDRQVYLRNVSLYRGSSLTRNRLTPGPYSGAYLGVYGGPRGGSCFL